MTRIIQLRNRNDQSNSSFLYGRVEYVGHSSSLDFNKKNSKIFPQNFRKFSHKIFYKKSQENFYHFLPKIFRKKIFTTIIKGPTRARVCEKFFLSLWKGKKALIPPLEFSKNIPCRILPAPFLFLIFRIPPEVPQVP